MTRDPDLIHHFGATARPGPEEPWRLDAESNRVPYFSSYGCRARVVAGRADWLASCGIDCVYAQAHQGYRAGYEAEVLDCLEASQ